MAVIDETGQSGGPENADRIASGALHLAGRDGWRGATLAAIAAEAGVTLAELAACYSSRPAILDGFERMLDRRMLMAAAGADDTPRDRLFGIIMERFDAMAPFRDGVRRIGRELPFDPPSGLVLAAALPRSIAWMFAGVGVAIDGPLMPVKLVVLTGAYLSTFRVWLGDDEPEMAKTMAALDRNIGRVTQLLGERLGGPRATTPVETPDASPDGAVGAEPKSD